MTIELNSKLYTSYEDVAEEYGISVSAIKTRQSQGYTLEEIVTTVEPRSTQLEVGDTVYSSIAELADDYGLKANTLRERLRRGIPLKEALVGEGKLREVVYKGTSYTSIKSLAESLDITYANLTNHIARGESMDKAVEACLDIKVGVKRKVKFRDKWYPSYSALASQFNISKQTLSLRLKNGWTLEEALTTPPAVRGGVK